MYEYNAIVNKIVDGDTIKVVVDLGFHISVIKTLRLARINAPETSTPEGSVSKQYLEKIVPPNTKITFTSKSLDRYGRSIAEVILENKNLSDLLVTDNMAIHQKY